MTWSLVCSGMTPRINPCGGIFEHRSALAVEVDAMKRPPMRCGHPGSEAEGVGSLRQRETPNGPNGHGERLDDVMTDKGTLLLSHASHLRRRSRLGVSAETRLNNIRLPLPPHRGNCG